jgi:Protein of unknown function (DUF2800)
METQERDLCSPSQLNLRVHCPGSANLQKKLPKGTGKASEAAARGTRLHKVFADALMDTRDTFADISKEDYEAVAWCIRTLQENVFSRFEGKPLLKTEYQIDLSELGIFGGTEGCRIDLFFVIPGSGCILVDEKYGIGYVTPPRWNWQFKAYAWGLHNKFGGSVEAIKLQPGAEEEKQYLSCVFEESEFEKIGDDIAQIVRATKEPDAPLIRGPHCSYLYCKCLEICPLHRQAVLEIPQGVAIAEYIARINPTQRKALYENLIIAEAWCKNAKEIISGMAINNTIEIPGYMIGEGKKTFAWADEQEALLAIQNFITDDTMGDFNDLIEPAHLKSKSKIESIIGKGKKAKALIESLVVTIPGKLYLKPIKTMGA